MSSVVSRLATRMAYKQAGDHYSPYDPEKDDPLRQVDDPPSATRGKVRSALTQFKERAKGTVERAKGTVDRVRDSVDVVRGRVASRRQIEGVDSSAAGAWESLPREHGGSYEGGVVKRTAGKAVGAVSRLAERLKGFKKTSNFDDYAGARPSPESFMHYVHGPTPSAHDRYLEGASKLEGHLSGLKEKITNRPDVRMLSEAFGPEAEEIARALHDKRMELTAPVVDKVKQVLGLAPKPSFMARHGGKVMAGLGGLGALGLGYALSHPGVDEL